MNQREERAWRAGYRAAWAAIGELVAGELGGDDPRGRALGTLAERTRAMKALRALAEQLGIAPDWPDRRYLPDVVSKSIGRQIGPAPRPRRRRAP